MMSETWVDRKEWKGMKKNIMKGYMRKMQSARKDHVKRREVSGMVSGVRKEVVVEEGKGEDME